MNDGKRFKNVHLQKLSFLSSLYWVYNHNCSLEPSRHRKLNLNMMYYACSQDYNVYFCENNAL